MTASVNRARETEGPHPPRWRFRPEGSTWGDWGENDQIGRLNLLNAEIRRAALREAREGIAFCLSLPLDYPGGSVLSPRRHPPQLQPTLREGMPSLNYPFAREAPFCTDIISDDSVLLHLQYSTQWDSLAHIGALFDADGDGVAEPVTTTAFAPASKSWARSIIARPSPLRPAGQGPTPKRSASTRSPRPASRGAA